VSLKDLFKDIERIGTTTTASAPDVPVIKEQVESVSFSREVQERQKSFVPHVDFTQAKNFAKYGSAEEYYAKGIEYIYSYYPYDGSLKEKEEWYNNVTYLEQYVFDHEYPRTNGYVILSADGWGTTTVTDGYGLPSSLEYIQVKSGPHEKNIWDESKHREENLKFALTGGLTVEFWLNKTEFVTSKTQKEVIFDLWNGKHFNDTEYGRFRIELSGTSPGAAFRLTALSGTSGFHDAPVGETVTPSIVSNSDWSHYAFSLYNTGSSVLVEMYRDGVFIESMTTGSAIGHVTGTMIANIGALRTPPRNTSAATGSGKLSGSLDEFRFWKSRRTARDIGRYYISQVGGGTNTDDANTELGLYYKFNEGITGDSTYDRVVLDYSGRLSNGTWTGYNSNSRNTGSAMVLSGETTFEFKDPIIYPTHPAVVALLNSKKELGEEYDINNPANMYNSFPSWIIDEDSDAGSELKSLTQIMSSYLDELYLQIENVPALKDKEYPSGSLLTGSHKPYPFSKQLLTSHGFNTPELFVDTSVIEQFLSRNEKIKYEEKIYNTKNLIYHNIYNNLINIFKSKGTEKSIRNLIRSYGADEDIIAINVYGHNEPFELRKNVEQRTFKNKVIDFNQSDRNVATIFQYQTGSGTTSYISGSRLNDLTVPNTVECEVFFPHKAQEGNRSYYYYPDISSSLFGQHTVNLGAADINVLQWADNDDASFQVYAVRDVIDSTRAKFVITGAAFSPLTTSYYSNVYENSKWNFAVRLKPSREFGDLVYYGSNTDYDLEFYGVHETMGSIEHEFILTSSLSATRGEAWSNAPKRIYAGAHRTNFTGSLLEYTDVKIANVRFWLSYLTNEVIQDHAKSYATYGPSQPLNDEGFTHVNLDNTEIPSLETLALNWNFGNVSSSADSSGRLLVDDFSSGSSELTSRYSWVGDITKQLYSGRADFFLPNEPKAADIEYVFSTRNRLPETFISSDMISIGEDADKIFTLDSRPVHYYFSIENSLYRVISEEIINIFSSIIDFNNLIGEPVNKYRETYKDLSKLKQLFFERVENKPDIERYFTYFKHIDSFLQQCLEKLLPASANVSDSVLNIVESHVLERNKYRHKFPTLESKQGDPEAAILGINEMLFDWKHGHAPIPENQNTNCLYWHDLAERGGSVLTSGNPTVDEQRETIKDIVNSSVSGSNYATRKFAQVYNLTTKEPLDLGGGANLKSNNIFGFYRQVIKFNDRNNYIKIPFAESKLNKDCKEATEPQELTKRVMDVPAIAYNDGEPPRANDYKDGNANLLLPFTIFSSSLDTGYLGIVADAHSASFENMHLDVVGTHGTLPLQGPFTEKYVGGLQYRHAGLNYKSPTKALDNSFTRPEGWFLKIPTAPGRAASLLSESFSATDPVGWRNVGSTATGPSGWILTHSGPTPSMNTGPNSAFDGDYYAYAETSNPNHPGSAFGLVTPIIDAADMGGDNFSASFYYHMYGVNVGSLKVQHCESPLFGASVTDLSVVWDFVSAPGVEAEHIAGQQQANATDPYKQAQIDLSAYAGTEFYLRFFYEGGITYLSDVAIDAIEVSGTSGGSTYKLLDPSWDNPNKPRAVYYRDEVAKRPLNIRNIKMTSSSPTIIGNYSHNYEVVNIPGRNVNNLWFVQNSGAVGQTKVLSDFITSSYDYSLKNRDNLQDGSKNRTVIVERFSAPGGPEVMSRGFLDVASETYSVYNCLNYRNSTVRNNLNIWEKHHSIWGGYDGVYGFPTASYHQVQRNTGLRLQLSGNLVLAGSSINNGMPVVTASYYDNGFVTHQIPQTDAGYAWISGSITGSLI
tara:strand:- start:15921 stop:21311 length:5391 start_codon:yes stop_codon:yes gene_type:complete